MKILIPNVTGPTNIGDQAILKGLLAIIDKSYPNRQLIIHSSVPDKYAPEDFVVKPSLYFWSVFEKPHFLNRVYRMMQLFLQYLFCLFNLRLPIGEKKLIELINDYRSADIIILVGGGYLRSTKGITQSLNLFMNLFQFIFAKLFKVKKILAPGSFGPFAYNWQEYFAAKVLQGFDVISVREEISLDVLSKYGLRNLSMSADQALLLDKRDDKEPVTDKFVLGFTVRSWGNSLQTQNNITLIAEGVEAFSKKIDLIVQPLVQVNAPDYGEDDLMVTKKVYEELKKRGVEIREVINIASLDEAMAVYNEIDILIGMRMHSNIIAATQHKPFVAIAYEHKTRGISRMLGVEEYCLDYSQYKASDLLSLLEKLYDNKAQVVDTIKERLEEIRIKEFYLWKKLL